MVDGGRPPPGHGGLGSTTIHHPTSTIHPEVPMSATATSSLAQQYSLRETREYKNYVNGQWVASKSGKTFENRNPADQDDLVGTFQESTADDVNTAVDAAEKAYE